MPKSLLSSYYQSEGLYVFGYSTALNIPSTTDHIVMIFGMNISVPRSSDFLLAPVSHYIYTIYTIYTLSWQDIWTTLRFHSHVAL